MKLERKTIEAVGCGIPAVILTPGAPRGAAVVVHGYGVNKEEILGLASRVAGWGLAVCALDLRGYGETVFGRLLRASIPRSWFGRFQ